MFDAGPPDDEGAPATPTGGPDPAVAPAASSGPDPTVPDVGAIADRELAARALEIERERTRLDAEQAVVLAELEARGVCDREFLLPTAAWLATNAQLPAAVARDRVKVASKLRRLLPGVAAALAAGTIGWDHAKVLADLANLRIADDVAANEDVLLGLVEGCRFERWRADVRSMGRLWDQDGAYDPNEDPASNKLSYGRTIDGLLTLAATLTGENAEVVAQAIETKTDELYRRAVADHEACADLEVPSRTTLRALALTELIRQALGVDLDSSKGPKTEATVVVNASDPTTGSDPDGVRLADSTTRLLFCDADSTP